MRLILHILQVLQAKLILVPIVGNHLQDMGTIIYLTNADWVISIITEECVQENAAWNLGMRVIGEITSPDLEVWHPRNQAFTLS
jgi:hypothetical protein